MEVIGFICVSLGSSTVQLHDSPGGRSACQCFGSKNGDRAEKYMTEKQRSVVRFSVGKKIHNAKDIHKETFVA
jgi:hypothetical protein